MMVPAQRHRPSSIRPDKPVVSDTIEGWYQTRDTGQTDSLFSDTTEGCHTPKHFAADQGYDIPATCTVPSVHERLFTTSFTNYQSYSKYKQYKHINSLKSFNLTSTGPSTALQQMFTGSSLNSLKYHKIHPRV